MQLTKKYRCVAGTDKIAKFNPMEPMIGVTEYSPDWYSLSFDADDVEEMRDFVRSNGILFIADVAGIAITIPF